MTNSLVLQPKRVSRSTVWRILVYSEAIGEERGKEEEERACWERSKLPPAPLGESRHSHLYFCFQKPPHWSPASCLNPLSISRRRWALGCSTDSNLATSIPCLGPVCGSQCTRVKSRILVKAHG